MEWYLNLSPARLFTSCAGSVLLAKLKEVKRFYKKLMLQYLSFGTDNEKNRLINLDRLSLLASDRFRLKMATF